MSEDTSSLFTCAHNRWKFLSAIINSNPHFSSAWTPNKKELKLDLIKEEVQSRPSQMQPLWEKCFFIILLVVSSNIFQQPDSSVLRGNMD